MPTAGAGRIQGGSVGPICGLAAVLLIAATGCAATGSRQSATASARASDTCATVVPDCSAASNRYGQTVPGVSGINGSSKSGSLHLTRTCGLRSEPSQEDLIRQTSMLSDVPRELRKATLPVYVIEPPDILLIDAVSHLRPADAPVHPGDPLLIQVNRTIPVGQQDEPAAVQFKRVNGIFSVDAEGYVDLGPEYGKVLVAGEPIDEVQRRVDKQLRFTLRDPQVRVMLADPDAKQYVAGQHLVRMDGTVGLGIYGSVHVTGLTLDEARQRIEAHLSRYIAHPEVAVDVLAYNSKVYYVVTDGGGAGEQVFRLPITGNETVLDAIANINGLPTVASKSDIWVARPSPDPCGPDQVLPVDWNGIVQGAQTATNYQVLPGDRIYVKADRMIIFDTAMAKITAPFERLLGFTILGNATVRTLQLGRGAFGNNGGGF